MYDIFLRLFREELQSSRITIIPRSKIDDYKGFMETNIRELFSLEHEARKYFDEVIEKSRKDLENLIGMRIAKLVLGSELPEQSFDKSLLEYIAKLIDFVSKYYAGYYIEYGDKVFVEFREQSMFEGKLFEKGDVALIEPIKALGLYVLGYVEPIYKPYIDYIR